MSFLINQKRQKLQTFKMIVHIPNSIHALYDRVKNRILSKSKPGFSTDWFTDSCNEAWGKFFLPLKDTAYLSYLEIGTYEGRSLLWMLDNVLTHPTSKAYAVDPMFRPYGPKVHNNIRQHPSSKKVTVIPAFSEMVLKDFPPTSMDIIYIDGAHDAKSVITDAVYSWSLLKPGGYMVFDDYLFGEEDMPRYLTPKPAIDLFLLGYSADIEILHKNFQVIIRKRLDADTRTHYESHFKHYKFDWYHNSLKAKTRKFPFFFRYRWRPIPLTEKEISELRSQLIDIPGGSKKTPDIYFESE